jgi:hypothetical protein
MRHRTIFQYALGSLIVIGFFTTLIIFIKIEVPTENKDILNLIIGALLASFSTVVGYFFGSSAGSAAKNDLLKRNDNPDNITK